MNQTQNKHIVIATGIYPPEIGGPAEYAKKLSHEWRLRGYTVSVHVSSHFNYLPTGIRHCAFFFSLLRDVFHADYVFILDTFSAALPAVCAARLCGVPTVLRTGGDFLWEAYVERTGELVLLRRFYEACISRFSIKEKMIFRLIRWVLRSVDRIVWSTVWQRDIFMKPYDLARQKHCIIENYYGERLTPENPKTKNFIAATRPSRWKNIPMIQKVFTSPDVLSLGVTLDTTPVSHDVFLEKIRSSYAVIVVSLGDISPNTILDSIRCQKPFIVTEEVGIYDRIKDIALFVDPLDEKSIHDAVIWLSHDEHYAEQVAKLQSYTFVHDWSEIASEYTEIFNTL